MLEVLFNYVKLNNTNTLEFNEAVNEHYIFDLSDLSLPCLIELKSMLSKEI